VLLQTLHKLPRSFRSLHCGASINQRLFFRQSPKIIQQRAGHSTRRRGPRPRPAPRCRPRTRPLRHGVVISRCGTRQRLNPMIDQVQDLCGRQPGMRQHELVLLVEPRNDVDGTSFLGVGEQLQVRCSRQRHASAPEGAEPVSILRGRGGAWTIPGDSGGGLRNAPPRASFEGVRAIYPHFQGPQGVRFPVHG
jgi:hypothetical protein